MTAGFISKKFAGSLATLVFVVCFNFFLFRVVDADPVANLYRGKELSQTQRAELRSSSAWTARRASSSSSTSGRPPS